MNKEILGLPAANCEPPPMTGTYADAERLRKWSFLQRTPQQRLDWLVSVLKIAYHRGAIQPRRPADADSGSVPAAALTQEEMKQRLAGREPYRGTTSPADVVRQERGGR
jgi:hypothetical protein